MNREFWQEITLERLYPDAYQDTSELGTTENERKGCFLAIRKRTNADIRI
jgi:hypothetical protein